MEMSISAGGRGVSMIVLPSYAATTPRMLVPPREIRFYSPSTFPTSSGRGAIVSPLLVWGGQIDERRALSRTERDQLLRTLSFLKPIP